VSEVGLALCSKRSTAMRSLLKKNYMGSLMNEMLCMRSRMEATFISSYISEI
jgi:hypothetical protein